MRRTDDDEWVGAPTEPPVRAGLIGCGEWGQKLLAGMGQLPRQTCYGAPLAQLEPVALCDPEPPTLRRANELAPRARLHTDYRAVLDDPRVELVFIATPTHTHLPLVLDALATGKHVWCETPLAHTVDDARRIALAGRAHKGVFATGLIRRYHADSCDASLRVASKELGSTLSLNAQFRRRWLPRFRSDPRRCRAVNWLWHADTSLGLVGEWGLSAFDEALRWCRRGGLGGPVSVRGWSRGIDTPDDVRSLYDDGGCEVTFARSTPLRVHASAVASFGGSDLRITGTDGTLWWREHEILQAREPDARRVGWTPYALQVERFDQVYLVTCSSGPLIPRERVVANPPFPARPLPAALSWQANMIRDDRPEPHGWTKGTQRNITAAEAYAATVLAIHAGQASLAQTTIKLDPAQFTLA